MARTNEKVEVRYRMRFDNVLIRVMPVGQVRGLFMPEASIQGVQFVVEEVGPDVKDLHKGDVVLIKGTPGKDCGYLPNDSKLLHCPNENVLLVIEPAKEEECKTVGCADFHC